MLGTVPVAELLDMLTPDADEWDTTGFLSVRDVLADKRHSEHYDALLEEIRRDGMALPVLIRTQDGTPWLADGHHRVAAAVDLGITHLVWTDIPLDVEPHHFNPMMRDSWGPYRPAA